MRLKKTRPAFTCLMESLVCKSFESLDVTWPTRKFWPHSVCKKAHSKSSSRKMEKKTRFNILKALRRSVQIFVNVANAAKRLKEGKRKASRIKSSFVYEEARPKAKHFTCFWQPLPPALNGNATLRRCCTTGEPILCRVLRYRYKKPWRLFLRPVL